jgi:hypothetical protein
MKTNLKQLTTDEQKFIEGYATALQDLEYKITGDNGCSKSYDPMKCESQVMHSYAFNMKDGGRHHPVKDYKDVREILETLLEEAAVNFVENTTYGT